MPDYTLPRRVARRRRLLPPLSPDHAFALLIAVASVGLFCFGRAYGHPYGRSPVQPIHLLGGLYWACGATALLASWCDGTVEGRRRGRLLATLGAIVGGCSLLVLTGLTLVTVTGGTGSGTAAFSVAATAAFAVQLRGFLRAAARP
jgi:hypothetical protein